MPNSINAQHTKFNTQSNWALNKKELTVSIGCTQFTGDLGGDDIAGTDFSLKDLDLKATSWNSTFGFRYRFHPYFSTSSKFIIGQLKGDDKYTNEIYRRNRNLHFKSTIFELEQRIEWIFLSIEDARSFSKKRILKGKISSSNQLYLYSGAGILFFNPKAQYNNQWIALRPLSTEGQGLPGGAKKYNRVTATIPFGLGIRIGINEMSRIGIEATYYKTFSDYIDDVHGNYFDRTKIPTPEGQFLSNPSVSNNNWTNAGQQRGGKQKDAFYSLNLVYYHNITYSKLKNINPHGYKF